MRRLLEQTELTKSRFLDRKFLRRQRRSGGQHISRLWYVEQQTWLASTTGVGPAAQEQQQQVSRRWAQGGTAYKWVGEGRPAAASTAEAAHHAGGKSTHDEVLEHWPGQSIGCLIQRAQ